MPATGSKEPSLVGKDAAEPIDSGRFASILGGEAASPPAQGARASEHELLPGGGKSLQPSGKTLPERPATELDELMTGGFPAVVIDSVPEDTAAAEDMKLEPVALPVAMRLDRFTTADGVTLTAAGSQSGAMAGGDATTPPALDLARTQAVVLPPAGSLPARYPSSVDQGTMLDQPPNPGASVDEALQLPNNIAKAAAMQTMANTRTEGAVNPPVSGDVKVDIPFELVDAVKVADVNVKLAEQLPPKPPSIDLTTVITGSNMPAGRELDLSGGLKVAAPVTMTTPVGHPGWSGEVAGRINLMVNGGSSEANLQLSPPELGRLEIRISTEDSQAKVQFAVQNAHAREAIEQAMPRLRDMLEQSGLQLAHSSVADQSESQQRGNGPAGSSDEPAAADLESGVMTADQTLLIAASDTAVDYYV